MIIVSGKIYLRAGARDNFLSMSHEAMTRARDTPGCLDFVVAADPLEPDRVNVYEAWESETVLLTFRGEGPDADLASVIVDADVRRHTIATTAPA